MAHTQRSLCLYLLPGNPVEPQFASCSFNRRMLGVCFAEPFQHPRLSRYDAFPKVRGRE
jgi:hypothetical protein